ncbi:HD-GYP domain-containing protein [Methylocucumis oryzae]|uniref:Phosphodiesterase n=1 Tax=Methylocucumis oryzae TaxID=1632867 RepID=A0A0F3IGM2_9GAMM|nr:HD domain-containing phosphohydrolase [Methylocucumis oryzae]KJV05852.1 phosphodiesterase [Methylocucumis oryzae]
MQPKQNELIVDLRQMILAIETAISLVGMNDTNHGKRVGYIACQIGKQLGFSDADIQYAFELGMLHDCGVSTNQMHANLVNYFDWNDAHIHCEIGYRILKNFEPLAKFAVPILYHHTPYPNLANHQLSIYDARMANLIFLSDRVDILSATHYKTDILLARNNILQTIIGQYNNTYFDPELVKTFEVVQRSEAFWIGLEDRHIVRYVWDMGLISNNQPLNLQQLKQLSLILSYIVDQKSPFTAQHSLRVANLASYLAHNYGFLENQCKKIEIAGLLHDLGKLHTPDPILEKPGPLDEVERSIMNQHSYETYEILRHIHGLEEIASWAAFHHECLNGGGYPFHPQERDLSTEARIIAVADVFQALVQDRPYRQGMALEQVLRVLDDQVRIGKLDKSIVDMAKQRADQCFAVAKGLDTSFDLNQQYQNLLTTNDS